MKVNKSIVSFAAAVVSAVRDTAENPGFIYSEPVFKFVWVWYSRKVMVI
jgi:hypothetical protein